MQYLDKWIATNPKPQITDCDDFSQVVKACYWVLRLKEAGRIDRGEEWPYQTDSYLWNIEQAIINRPKGLDMLSSGIAYVDTIDADLRQ